MDYADHLETRPGVLGGKPLVKGTRISVELILGFLAAGWSVEEVVREYPSITSAHLQAIFALAHELISEECFVIDAKVA